MTDHNDPMATRSVHRLVTGAFGILLVVVAVLVASNSHATHRVGALIVAVVLAALGIDAMVAAIRARRAWVSRIGPLP